MPENVIITIDGKKQDLGVDLQRVEVDTNLHMPAMFTITVRDDLDRSAGKLTYGDVDSVFKVGAEVKIELETDEIWSEASTVKATLIIGEITAVEPSFSNEGKALLQVRGYDRSLHLTRGKKTRTYGDANPQGSGINEEQIINTIVQETSAITGKQIDTSGFSSIKYPYVMQYNQTDLEFLWSRARRLGYQVYVEDKTLYFQKADAHRGAESDKPGVMTWNRNLGSFAPRLTVMHQVDKALVTGWDPHAKTAIEGTSDSDSSKTIPAIGLNKKGSALAKEALKGTAEEVIVDHPVLTVDEAKAMAGARFAAAESEFVRADGTCRQGDPRLIAGRLVTIESVGERFSGNYYVTEARHVYARGSYVVTFSVTGRAPQSLSYLLHERNGQEASGVQGVVTAKVVSLEDPENLGRVQVMYPWLPKYKSADLASNWARMATPMGGPERGFYFLPEIDDEVLVGFEHGDVGRPFVVGVLWNHKDKPPAGTKNVLADDKKKVNQRVLRSRSGHLIVLDDTEGEEQIIIQDQTGKNNLIINSKDNSMAINAEGNITLTAKGDLTLDAGGKMVLKSTGDLSLESQAKGNIKTTSDLALEASGGNGNFKALQMALEGSVKSELKGATVAVQGSAMTEIKGALVKIN